MVKPDIYPRLTTIVTSMVGRVGPYPSLRYSVSSVLHQTREDVEALAPNPPINVIEEEKNRRVTQPLADLVGKLRHGSPPHDEIHGLMRCIGEWISEFVLPPECVCCCHGSGLPRTIEIMADQHEIPWELAWIQDDFLARKTLHSRYPFVSRARHGGLIYKPAPSFAVIVGRSAGLSLVEAEIAELSELYATAFGDNLIVFNGESVSVDLIRTALGKFDIVHYIGHGDGQADQVWLELLGPPFLDNHIPASIAGNPLVFWNCCLGGASASARYRYQADVVDGFGSKLLSRGAGHFIGSLFPVSDSTAKDFAVSFYRALFQGVPVGLAFYDAKLQLSESDPIALTYVLYGNPGARVVQHA